MFSLVGSLVDFPGCLKPSVGQGVSPDRRDVLALGGESLWPLPVKIKATSKKLVWHWHQHGLVPDNHTYLSMMPDQLLRLPLTVYTVL